MNLALFDFDGTITDREMFPSFIQLAVAPRRLAVGKLLLAPLIVGYKLGLVSGTDVRAAIVKFGFSGVPLAILEAHGSHFARSVLPPVLRPQALERINWHKERGDTVVVVSGAFDTYLSHWCQTHQLDLICSSLEHKDGVLTGRYLGRQCVLEEKARRVSEAYDLSRYSRIYAYGDTKEDLGLLALAHERYYRWQQVPACGGSETQSGEPKFANESTGFNLIPFAGMAGGWIAPLLMFWLYVWGPLRPFHYPPGDLAPDFLKAAAVFMACIAPWWLPGSYYEVRPFERSGRVYEALGVKLFRRFVPDGDLANRWRRRREPTHRIIRNRRYAEAFVARTVLSEKSHMVLLLVGLFSSAYAWQIGWQGWAIYLTVGNLLVNVYPIFLQRYTRARLLPIVGGLEKRGVQ